VSRILLDQNVPRALGAYLTGHEIWMAAEHGWAELENGDLMRAAGEAGCALMVTCDQNIRYQQNMATRPIGLVVLSTNYWPTLRTGAELMLNAVSALKPKGYVFVECGRQPKRRRP
jgi:hypothetical protein